MFATACPLEEYTRFLFFIVNYISLYFLFTLSALDVSCILVLKSLDVIPFNQTLKGIKDENRSRGLISICKRLLYKLLIPDGADEDNTMRT